METDSPGWDPSFSSSRTSRAVLSGAKVGSGDVEPRSGDQVEGTAAFASALTSGHWLEMSHLLLFTRFLSSLMHRILSLSFK